MLGSPGKTVNRRAEKAEKALRMRHGLTAGGPLRRPSAVTWREPPFWVGTARAGPAGLRRARACA